jgi:hypothetical protein
VSAVSLIRLRIYFIGLFIVLYIYFLYFSFSLPQNALPLILVSPKIVGYFYC